MNAASNITLRTEVEALLTANGYVKVASPVSIGGISLELPDVWEGPPESLDLSLITERPETREAVLKLFWSLQRLTRALDAAHSRRTVTVVVVGRRAAQDGLGELLELARVLVVDGSLSTSRMIGPLLRLTLPSTAAEPLDGLGEVAAAVGSGPKSAELLRLVRAASAGATFVNDRYESWIEESFTRGSDHG